MCHVVTRSDLEAKLEDVKRAHARHDDEDAHGCEDEMRRMLLRALAADTLTGITPQEAANLCLETEGMDFARWCA